MESNTMFTREDDDQECDTIFYQGINNTQTHALKYTGNQKITATTGEIIWSLGANALTPLKVIYNLHIGPEIADVNTHPFDTYSAYFNPLKVFFSLTTYIRNYYSEGVRSLPALNPSPDSVIFHTPNVSQVSIGQASDIESHSRKYQNWFSKSDKKNGLILWGVSRGTAATFCAFSKYKYPEVKLVVLEGAIDSLDNVFKNMAKSIFKSERVADSLVNTFNKCSAFLHRMGVFGYRKDGESPMSLVNDFPENIPVVFITSKKDLVVHPENTENIATSLANRGKNDVYLLKLENSSHPNYMYSNKTDRDTYEAFIHAIYRKYGLQHDAKLADDGEKYVESSILATQHVNMFTI